MTLEPQVFLTVEASEQIKKQLIKRGTPDGYLRLGVKGGSCEGYENVIQFEDKPPRPKDLLFDLFGIKILIDPKSLVILNGSTLDFEKSVMSQGFKFINPNKKSECGCGKSFSV
jgi:iron-sulfur cluster assembly protein